MKEVIPSNSRLVLTSYCCPQGMDFLQAFMLLENLFRNSGHSGNYGFSLQNYSKMYHIQFIQPGKSLEHILMQPAVISNPNRVIFRSLWTYWNIRSEFMISDAFQCRTRRWVSLQTQYSPSAHKYESKQQKPLLSVIIINYNDQTIVCNISLCSCGRQWADHLLRRERDVVSGSLSYPCNPLMNKNSI